MTKEKMKGYLSIVLAFITDVMMLVTMLHMYGDEFNPLKLVKLCGCVVLLSVVQIFLDKIRKKIEMVLFHTGILVIYLVMIIRTIYFYMT